MEGKGAYNRSSSVQEAGSLPAIALFKRAARLVPLETFAEAMIIADYGSSEGHNSLSPISAAIDVLRERGGSDQAVFVFHVDVPGNDFTALFETLAKDPDSYVGNRRAVFSAAIGRSYFEQILPASSVSLGWSAWAIQWLSRVPGTISDHVVVAYSRDAAARSAFAQQSAEDWRTFLTMRSLELRPGARLVLVTMATDDHDDFGYRQVVDALYGGLISLVRRGVIRNSELQKMAIPAVGRTRTQLTEPFGKTGHFADLVLESIEMFYGDDPIWRLFQASGDAQTYGAQWAAFCRASVFPTLAMSLDRVPGDPRPAKFFDELEGAIAAQLSLAPVPMKIPLAQMTLVKAISEK
jgi:hypothetical protein